MSEVEFGYWGIRGLGHVVQLTMAVCELPYSHAI